MKTDLPKRLAARVRAAIAKVSDARSDIVASEFRIRRDRARVAEFEADPELFARTHYGRHAPESYPVHTNISRARESLDYRTGRLPAKQQVLEDAEAQLAKVEEEVLSEVLAMRPTRGRVPWPAPPRTLENERAKLQKELAAADVAFERVRQERLREGAELEKKWARLQDIEDANSDRAWQVELASMSPEHRAEEKELTAKLNAAIDAGAVTPRQVLERLIEQSRAQRNGGDDESR